MLQIEDTTPFATMLSLMPDARGVDTAILAIKGTFDFRSSGLVISQEQHPLTAEDVYWGDPAASSLRYASEVTLPKPSTDIVLNGTAYAPGGRPALEVEVELRVADLVKTVVVSGDRFWKKSLTGAYPTDPEPFEAMPLRYERAFGGCVTLAGGEEEGDVRNPVGTGFQGRVGREYDGTPLPNLEDPEHLIRRRKDRPPPAGFGYVAPSWEYRSRFAGTYDDSWQTDRAPYLPADFSNRFFNAAHPDLISPKFLQGGEPVFVRNACPGGFLRFTIPRLELQALFLIGEEETVVSPNLDTVLLEPDEHRLSLLWRAALQVGRRGLELNSATVRCLQTDIYLETPDDG